MRSMNLKPALLYQLDYMLRASLGVLGVLILVALGSHLLAAAGIFSVNIDTSSPGEILDLAIRGAGEIQIEGADYDGEIIIVNWLNVGAVALLSLFIVGIVGIREDIKFLLQHGMGRRTVFTSTFLASLISAAAIGLINEGFNLISSHWAAFPFVGLTFDGMNHGFFAGWLFHVGILFCAWQLGTFISLLYYRMNKIQQIVFSVVAGGFILLVMQGFVRRVVVDVDVWIENFMYTLENLHLINISMITLIIGLVAAAFSFMLIRRTQVKE